MIRLFISSLLLAVVSAFAQQSAKPQLQSFSVVVEKGEQVGSIAQRYLIEPANAHWAEVAKLNKLKSQDKIYPGMTLQLPVHLLASQTAPAKWLSVTGDVRVQQKSGITSYAVVGGGVVESDRVVVAPNSTAILELPDGTQIQLMQNSDFVMEESRYYIGRVKLGKPDTLTGTKAFSGLMRLVQGALETRAVTATDRAKPLRIQTPTAVVGVRGTDFRVSYGNVTRTETLQGLVAAQLDDIRKTEVAGGFGVKLDPAEKQIPVVVALLSPPDLKAWPTQQDEAMVAFPALPNAQDGKRVNAYRIQLASDAEMKQVAYNKVFPSDAVIRISDLAEGAWHMAVRGVDEQGLEGKNATASFTLKVKPLLLQPPLIQLPQNNARMLQGSDVQFSWTKVVGAHGYVLEILSSDKALQRHEVTDSKLTVKNLPAGEFQWRIATQMKTATGEVLPGPWSDMQQFILLDKPAPLAGELDKDGRALNLRWKDMQAKEYELQFSREPDFESGKSKIEAKKATRPELAILNLEAGKHYIRYRAIEADGFVGNWSSTMEAEVPSSWEILIKILGWAAIAL
ncbi:MAG: hypothetical protein RLY82_72 [Pseudomonadota bacterium]|jgi:hypothetical protein